MSDRLDARAGRPAARPRWSPGCGGLRPRAGPGGRQRRRGGPAEEHCDLCGKPIDPDHRHLLHLVDRRILCACESCGRCAAATPSCARPGRARVWLDDFELPDEIWAAFGIPIGLAFFMRLERTGGIVALYPSPAGATESELDARGLERAAGREPGAEGLEPDAEALIVNRMADPPAARDRADRRVLPARRADQGRAGRASPAAPGVERRDRRRSSPSCGSGARVSEGRRRGRWRRPARAVAVAGAAAIPEFEVLGAGRSSAPRRRRSASTVRGRPSRRAARVHDRAHGADHDRARPSAATTPRPASGWSSSSASPSAGRSTTTELPLGAGRRAGARRSAARPSSSSRCPAPTTSRSRQPSTSTALADGEAPLRFHFNGTRLLRGRRRADADRPDPVGPLAAVPDAGRGLARDDRRRTTRTAAGCRSTGETLAALQRLQGRARAADLRRGASTSCSRARSADGRGARAARRLAALRGLRALPVHARGDQERDPDPVRDRLPAGLRRGHARATFDHLRLECVLAAGPEARGRARRSASCRPRASATGRSSAGWSSGRPRSTSWATASGAVRVRRRPRRCAAGTAACRAARRAAGAVADPRLRPQHDRGRRRRPRARRRRCSPACSRRTS